GERQVVQYRRDRDDDGLDQENEGEVRGELAEEDSLAAPRIEEELLEGSVLQLELIRPVEGQDSAEEDGQPEDAGGRGPERRCIGPEGEPEEEEDHAGEEDDGVEVGLGAPLGGQVLPGQGGGPGQLGAPAHPIAPCTLVWTGTVGTTAGSRPAAAARTRAGSVGVVRPWSMAQKRSTTGAARTGSWVATIAAPPAALCSARIALTQAIPSASKAA